MKKITAMYRVLLCCIVTISVQLYAQICGPCSLNLLNTITSGGITNPEYIAYSPDGRCFAAVNPTSHTVSVFRVDPQTCTVTPVGAFATGGLNPVAAAYSPNGRCLVVTNAGGVSVFEVDSETCALSLVTDQPINTEGSNPAFIAFSPLLSQNSNYCFAVVNSGSNTVSVFTLNPTTCQAALLNTYDVNPPSMPFAVQYSPDGTCLVVSNLNTGNGPGTLSIFAVNQTTCALESRGFVSSNGLMPTSVTYLRDGQCLAVTNSNITAVNIDGATNISIFSVDQDCGLTLIPENTVVLSSGSLPFAGAYSSNANCFALASVLAGTVTNYAVSSTCQLTQIGEPITVNIFPNSLAYSLQGTFLVVASQGADPGEGSISLLRIESNITIRQVFSTCLSPASVYGTSAQPGATVRLYVDDTLIAASTADAEGNFFMANLPVSVGNHCFVAEDVSTGCISLPVCADIKIVLTCHLFTPNMSFGVHCSR